MTASYATVSEDRPLLSIIVIFHNMRREAARTLYSLSADYQRGIDEQSYEVIALDNGSSEPLSAGLVRNMGPQFRYEFFETQSVSPVAAINHGAAIAKGDCIAIIVDGARMATPGLVAETIAALELSDRPFVSAMAWHLGPDEQPRSITMGYNRSEEDKLLGSIKWRENGYRLFEISSLASSSYMGLRGGLPMESSWSAVKREMFEQIGGYDERFVSPGGGLASHDYQKRILSSADVQPVILLGEGTFHQIHGGVATNAPLADDPLERFNAEYRAIRGQDFSPNRAAKPEYYGKIRQQARRFHLFRSRWPQRYLFEAIRALKLAITRFFPAKKSRSPSTCSEV